MRHTPLIAHRFLGALLLALAALYAPEAQAFKVKMHVRTANVAMYDAMDGAICMPGLTQHAAEEGQLPPQLPLGNTALQHFFSEYDENGQIETSYRTWLLQYAPYVRAGSIGPDGFPDMIIGQLFVHANHASPYDCESLSDGDCLDLNRFDEGPNALTRAFDFGISQLGALMQFAPESEAPRDKNEPKLSLLKKTFLGKPEWRSIDWAHEVLYRALHYHDDVLLDDNGLPNLELTSQQRNFYLEEKRAAIAFAMGYFMHMVGDGQIHTFINRLVAMPWSYFDTRTPKHPVYGPMSMMQEELQHMALERYISGLYLPGTEPAETMRHVDGLACAPFVPADKIEAQCIPDEELRPIQVESCNQCNPLRSINPADVDSRCDHCFKGCNPWKRICPPTLPTGGIICPRDKECRSLEDERESCKSTHTTDVKALNACLYSAEATCTDKVERCACNQSIKVLKDMRIIPQDQVEGTCLSDLSRTLSEETRALLDKAAELASDTFKDETYTPEVRESLERALTEGFCDTQPLDQHRVLGAGFVPTNPIDIRVPDEQGNHVEDATFDPAGILLDLNQNGRADLLNECILFNCRINPHSCPYNALDRDIPDDQATDAIPCRTIANAQGFEHLRYDPNSCDSGLYAPTAIDVDVNKLINAPRDAPIVEHFLNSNYIAAPKKFLSSVFYKDRRYHDLPQRPSHMANGPGASPRQPADYAPTLEPGELGTYSLGGYPVNAVHSMIDLLSMIRFYTRVGITDAIGMARRADPNNTVFRFLDRVPQVIDAGIAYLKQVAKALRESTVLNFEIRNPFTGNVLVTVDLGQRLARSTLIIADYLALIMPALQEGADRLMSGITSGLSLRMERLDAHLTTEWPKITTCMAEFANSGGGRFYAIDRVKQFMMDAINIMVTGATTCTQPQLVRDIIRGNVPNIRWTSQSVNELMQSSQWVSCEVERVILQRFYMEVLLPAFSKLYEETARRFVCPIVGIDAQDGKDLLARFVQGFGSHDSEAVREIQRRSGQTPDTKAGIDKLCEEAVELLFNPIELMNPLTEYVLGQSPFQISNDPPLTLRDFYRNMRVITTGTCWDGDLGHEVLLDRDRVRAAFGDFAITKPDGTTDACPDNQQFFSDLGLSQANEAATPSGGALTLDDPSLVDDPVWSPIRRALAQEFAPQLMPTRPTEYRGEWTAARTRFSGETYSPYRDFMKPNAYDAQNPARVPWIYEHPWEFDSRPGPPLVKTLDRMMNAPDPHSELLHEQLYYDEMERKFAKKKVHLMNSVGFTPVYNTMQLNKLSFMGPGSPVRGSCMIDEAQCLKDHARDPQRCQTLRVECEPGSIVSADLSKGTGLYSMIIHGNNLQPQQLGSGQQGWRDPRDLFHDIAPIKATGSKDEVLSEFFQEQYLSTHQPDVSHPGYRSCKSLDYHPLCNSIYDLDDPDQYCRQGHAWAYFLIKGLEDLEMLTRRLVKEQFGVTLPDRSRRTYRNEIDRTTESLFAAFWPKRSHDQCAWLSNSDNTKLRKHINNQSTNSNLEINLAKPYTPNKSNNELTTDLRNRNKNQEMLTSWLGNESWGHADHARDYAPTTRSFILDTTRRTLEQSALPEIAENGDYRPAPSTHSHNPTRFSLANKDSHISRIYSKTMSPHYCPLSPDQKDTDCDGIPDLCDNCPMIYNPDQQNSTDRGAWSHQGDACRGLDPIIQDLRCEAPVPTSPTRPNDTCEGNCCCQTVQTPSSAPTLLFLFAFIALLTRKKSNHVKTQGVLK